MRCASPTSATDGRLALPGPRRPRHRGNLREPRARARHDLPGDSSREFRAGRDGDVHDLSRVESHQRRHAVLGGILHHRRARLRARRAHRKDRHPTGRERPRARGRGGVHRAPRDLEQHRRLDLHLHHQGLPEPFPQGAAVRHPLHVGARARRDRRYPRRPHHALPFLPLHAPRPGDARRGAEPAVEPPRRHPRRLDARARLGARRRGRRGRGDDGGADRLPRSEHDGRDPALRIRGGAPRRHRQPDGRGDRWIHGRRARESARRLRHRQRAQAHRGACSHRRRAARTPLGLLRQRARLSRMSRTNVILLAVLLTAACALPFIVSNYRTFQFTLVLVYAIALLGLNILTGYNGQISLGHGAFYALGAYCAAILMDKMGAPYWVTIPAAGAVCLVAGFLFGLPALRLEGLYLALATFALGVATPQLLKYHHLEKWTGGVQGIVIAKPEAPFGLPINADQWLYFFTLAVTLGMFLLAWNLLRGRIGRALMAIRDHHLAAESMGVYNALYKSLAFGVSALYTGVAGALGAIAVQFVAPDSFNIFLSIMLLVGIVVGGLASISGALYGALFIQFVPNIADEISKAAPWAIFGIFMIGFVYLMPTGVAGAVRLLLARRKTYENPLRRWADGRSAGRPGHRTEEVRPGRFR